MKKTQNAEYEDVYVDVENLDWFREFKANETPAGNLRFYRILDNLTKTQLAQKLGTTTQGVSGMERGTRPISRETAKKLAAIFRTSPVSFI
jgi:DNA-binding XRE family transcriptional regulator